MIDSDSETKQPNQPYEEVKELFGRHGIVLPDTYVSAEYDRYNDGEPLVTTLEEKGEDEGTSASIRCRGIKRTLGDRSHYEVIEVQRRIYDKYAPVSEVNASIETDGNGNITRYGIGVTDKEGKGFVVNLNPDGSVDYIDTDTLDTEDELRVEAFEKKLPAFPQPQALLQELLNTPISLNDMESAIPQSLQPHVKMFEEADLPV